MSKSMKEASQKTVQELEKSVVDLRLELAKLTVESSVSQQKNTNTVPNKRKQLAVLLTALRQKKS
ncbi:50S ribosomal protein L29 [Candidatus Roizmanbacteria bacterium CG11_big_fil_rev_8_21_14_0_20_37_16]|uniref:Large ribosomal subunit protein uL29 n=1 Tax=Candidatus Roizmanbacteria bacterium CG11_big_fil_rev_8_21_14_0_20_37_16 TaxID=1974857 RepID=A0A2H0KKU3_9BACT|nr:MAG: 50S ribosomal protein L29 [Candidatus Roizmanbacteria bacterium CG11_big_fil_rev_8_21_14_0_20_37_16]